MNRTLILLGALVFGFVVFAGCAAPGGAVTGNKYTNQKYGFSIECPAGWSMVEDGGGGTINALVLCRGPVREGFSVNLNIVTEEAAGYTLDQYVQAVKTVLSVMNFTDEGPLTVNGQPAYFEEYSLQVGDKKIKQKQVMLLKNNSAYIITFTSTEAAYDEFVGVFNNAVNTLTFAATAA